MAERQAAKLRRLRQQRNHELVRNSLENLKRAAAREPKPETGGQVSPDNTMPHIIAAVRAYATVGEICDALREVYGTYQESTFA